MYSVLDKYVNKGKMIDKTEIIDLDGFLMSSRNKAFKIGGSEIRQIKVMDKELANPLVSKQVFKRYERLLAILTELLVDDDDSGDNYREALNQIEKFRLEIKNKYRKYLKQKELEMMSKQLVALQGEAKSRLMEIQRSYEEFRTSHRSK